MRTDNTTYGPVAIAVQSAYYETRLHNPQATSDAAQRLRDKLDSRAVTLTPDVLRALACAIANDRDC